MKPLHLLTVAFGALLVAAFVPLNSQARAGEPIELGGHCPPDWPVRCPHNLPVKGDCFARGVSCSTVRHCPPETFARACSAGKSVVCWQKPQNGNYGDCR